MNHHVTLLTLGFYFFFYGGIIAFPPNDFYEGLTFQFAIELFVRLLFIGIGLLCLIRRQHELKPYSKKLIIKKLYQREIIVTLLLCIIVFIPNFLTLPAYYVIGALQFLWFLKWVPPLQKF